MKRFVVPIAAALVVAIGSLLPVPAARADAATGEISITSKSPQAVTTYKVARDLMDNLRTTEAMAQYKKAIAIDPKFALAHAYLGSIMPGSEGLKELERASTLAAKLPENERLEVQALLASKRGQEDAARDLWVKLSQAAPRDWHVQFTYGQQLAFERKWDQATAALEMATELNPKAGEAYNSLGYAYLSQDKTDEAAEAFRKYSALRPDEPNPYDSLAEALMAGGHLEDAEANFRKALELSPQFYVSWEGIAQTRFLRNDAAGGWEALAKARAAATRPVERFEVDYALAWSQFAAGKLDEAMKTLDALEKEAQAGKVEGTYAFVPIERANMLLESGKPEAAIEQVTVGMERGQKSALPGSTKNAVLRAGLGTRTAAEARLGKADDAAKTLALLEAEAKAAPSNAGLQSQVQFARGEVALARGDAKAAAEAFSRCNEQDSYYHWRQAVAQQKAGDTEGAAQTLKKLMDINRRGADYLYVRSQLGPVKPAPVAEQKEEQKTDQK